MRSRGGRGSSLTGRAEFQAASTVALRSADGLVFGAGMTMTNYYGVEVSRNGRWLQVSASEGTEPEITASRWPRFLAVGSDSNNFWE